MSSTLKKLRRQEVDYEYLNDLYAEFNIDKNSEKFKVKIIPLCNFIAHDLFVKISTPYYDDYQEYFSASVAAVYNCLKRRNPEDFNSPNAFYVYMKTSSWFDARNLLLQDRKNSTRETAEMDFDESQETVHGNTNENVPVDIRDTLDFDMNKDSITRMYLRLTELYGWADKVVLRRLYFDFLNEKDRGVEKYTPDYSEFTDTLDLTLARVKELDKTSRIIFKIALMHNMNDDFSIKKSHKIRKNGEEYYDKFFLVLACMDKYPYLMELLTVLGTEKFFELLKVFGGISVNIPKISDLRRVDSEVSNYIEFLDKSTPEEIKKAIADGSRTTLGFVNGTSSKINAKLDTILKDAYTDK